MAREEEDETEGRQLIEDGLNGSRQLRPVKTVFGPFIVLILGEAHFRKALGSKANPFNSLIHQLD